MEINKELIEKVKQVNSVLEIVSVATSPNGEMYRVQSSYTINSEYKVEKEEDLNTCIIEEIKSANTFEENCLCGICIAPYSYADIEYDEDDFIPLVKLVTDNWELQKLVTVYPSEVKQRYQETYNKRVVDKINKRC